MTLIREAVEHELDEDNAAAIFGAALLNLLGLNEGIAILHDDETLVIHRSLGEDGHERINIDYFEDAVQLAHGQKVWLHYENDDQIEMDDDIATLIPFDNSDNETVH